METTKRESIRDTATAKEDHAKDTLRDKGNTCLDGEQGLDATHPSQPKSVVSILERHDGTLSLDWDGLQDCEVFDRIVRAAVLAHRENVDKVHPLEAARQRKNVSVDEACNSIGVSLDEWNEIIELRGNPLIPVLLRLRQFFGEPVDDLLAPNIADLQ